MPLLKEVGTLTSPGSPGAQVVSLSNFGGETPKALLIWGTQQTADGVAVNCLFTMGIATSATNLACWGINSEDNGFNLDDDRRHDTDAVIVTLSFDGLLSERATFTSFSADAFTINWATAAISGFKYHYLVLGGSSLTDAKVVQVFSPLSTGAQNYAHGMSEVPTALLAISAANTQAAGGNDGGSQTGVNVGALDITSSVHSGAYIDALSSARTHSSNFLEHSLVGGSIETATVTSVDATNITLNWTGADTREYFYILALAGVTAEVGVFTSPATAIAVTVATSIEPEVFLTWGVLMPNSAFDESDGRFCFGASDGTNQACAGVLKNQARAADQFSNSSSVLQVYDDTPTLLEAATVAMSGNDATVTFATADSALNEFQWLALGTEEEVPVVPEDPAEPIFGGPGVRPISEVGFTKLCWGGDAGKGLCVFGSARFSSSTTDANNTPATLLRPGLVVANITATGYYSHYTLGATDGTGIALGILMDELSSIDLAGGAVDRVWRVLLAGPVRADNVIGLDAMARRQLGPRFMFDDDLKSVRHFLDSAWTNDQVITDTTLTAADAGKLIVCTDADVEITLPELATSCGFAVDILRASDHELKISSAECSNIIMGNTTTADSLTFTTAGEQTGVRVRVESIHVGSVKKWLLTYFEPPLGTTLGTVTFAIDGTTTPTETLWEWESTTPSITQANWNAFVATLPAAAAPYASEKMGSNSLSLAFGASGYRIMVPHEMQVAEMEADGRLAFSRETSKANGNSRHFVSARKVTPYASPQFSGGQYLVPARHYRETLVFNMESNGFTKAQWAALGPSQWVQIWERHPGTFPVGWVGTQEGTIAIYCYNDQFRVQVHGALGSAKTNSAAFLHTWNFTAETNPHTFVIDWFVDWDATTGIGSNGSVKVTHNGVVQVDETQEVGLDYGGDVKAALWGFAGLYTGVSDADGPAHHLTSWKIEEL